MPHTTADHPFAYRLPTDVAVQIRDTPLVTMGSSRTRLVVLLLTFFALAGGLAATLASGQAQAMVKHDCVYNPYWESVNYVSDAADCW